MVSWIRPIRIFLIVAALQLLVSQGVGPTNYQVYLERTPAGELSVSVSNRREQPWFASHLIRALHFYSFWYAAAILVSLPARLNPLWYEVSLLSIVYPYQPPFSRS